MLLLQTVHGSHLYGTYTPDSDYDTYEVHRFGKTRQRVRGQDDRTRTGLVDFTAQVLRGVPQALEALYSPYAWMEPEWEWYFKALRPGYYETLDRYRRTIINFHLDPRGNGLKRRKHDLRLYLNLEEFKRKGHFNPVIAPKDQQWIASLVDTGTDGTFLISHGFEIPSNPSR